MRFDELVAQAEVISSKVHAADTVEEITVYVERADLSEDRFNQLPFGAIQLDAEGMILRYNEYESDLSGVQRETAIGKHFFTELAPCTDVKEFHGRFKEGVARKSLHEDFRYHFAFKHNPIDVTVALFYSDLTESIWVFVRQV